jgi:hypothetical protein
MSMATLYGKTLRRLRGPAKLNELAMICQIRSRFQALRGFYLVTRPTDGSLLKVTVSHGPRED